MASGKPVSEIPLPETGQAVRRPDGYVWSSPGLPLRVVVWPNAAERIRLEAVERPAGDGASEAGGLLLGRLEQATPGVVVIENAEPLAWPQLLSEGERGTLEAALARHSAGTPGKLVVGYYRTQSQDEIFLNALDLAIIRNYFPGPANVFLLLKPSGAELATRLFYRQGTQLRSEENAPGFPFGRPVYRVAAGRRRPEAAVEFASAEMPGESGLLGRGFWWTVAALLAAAALFYAGATFVRRPFRTAPAARVVRPAPAQLSLQVEKRSSDLLLRWDRNSPAVAGATRGVLEILDGAYRNPYMLDADQLRTGAVYYTPLTGDVRFRLEVFGAGEPAVESVRVLSSVPASVAVAPLPVPAADGHSKQAAAPRTSVPVPHQEASRVTPAAPPLRFAPPPDEQRAVTLDAPEIAVARASPGIVSAIPGAQPGGISIVPPSPAQPSKPAAAQPALDLGSAYVGPQIVRRVEPAIPANLRSPALGNSQVSVRVSIDQQGRVSKAEVTSWKGPVNALATQATLSAARAWRFKPATIDGRPVVSGMVLIFRFGS